MKNKNILHLTLILYLFCSIKLYGQTNDSIFNSLKFPNNLTITIKNDTTYFKEFKKKLVATITFSSSKSSVFYMVFRYEQSDSLDFENDFSKYIMQSNCYFTANKDLNKNFKTFTKDGYYFLQELCPCRTIKNIDCAELAKTLNEWINVVKK